METEVGSMGSAEQNITNEKVDKDGAETHGTCPKCGASTPAGDNWCGMCGEGLKDGAETEGTCPKCGAQTTGGDNWCGMCGEGLKKE